MRDRFLITHSLISAFDFWQSMKLSNAVIKKEGFPLGMRWGDYAYGSLVSLIKRDKPFSMSPAAQRGINVEALLYKYTDKSKRLGALEELKDTYSLHNSAMQEGLDHFSSLLEGCGYQKTAIRELESEKYNGTFVFYMKADAWKENEYILDIKTTEGYSPYKYLDSFQHFVYLSSMPCPQNYTFHYLVLEFEKGSNRIIGLHQEDFCIAEGLQPSRRGMRDVKYFEEVTDEVFTRRISKKIESFFDWLNEPGNEQIKDAYVNKFSSRKTNAEKRNYKNGQNIKPSN